ncbi:MAG: hypothetical protein AAGC83_02695 [Pseudomonadota bacterium]
MDFIDLSGVLASGLVLLTFCMRSMMYLRAIGILSNIAFICYATSLALFPILILHSILMIINVTELYRLLARNSEGLQGGTLVKNQ